MLLGRVRSGIPLLLCFGSSFAVAQVEAPDNVEHVEVKGRAQEFYLDSRSKVGTKTDADIMEIPLSVQVLTAELIEDQAARDITDMYRSIAGVSEFSYSGVTFRGFRDSDNVFYDGVRGDPYSGFSVPQLFNVERVEILKGPAGALYGGGEPGGMINYVTRKPGFNNTRKLTLTAGNFSLAGISVDMTGPLNDELAYRFGAFYESQDSFRNNADAENIELAGGLLWQLGDDTALTTTYDYIVQNLGGNRLRGVPVDDNGNFLVGRSYNANEKSDFQDLEALVVQSNLTHSFSDDLSLNATARYLTNDRQQQYHESRDWIDANGDGEANVLDEVIRREYRVQYRENEEISLTLDLVYDFALGGVSHQLLFGGDYFHVDTDFDYYLARYEADGVANLNIFELNYGITDPSAYNLTDMNGAGLIRKRASAYVQDAISLSEQWTLMLGARWDTFEEESKANGATYSDNNIVPRVGLSYMPTINTTLYANYSESFQPVSAADQLEAGVQALSPETGDQIELGIKQNWLDGAIMTTFAVYQIDKENLVNANPEFVLGENDDSVPALINYGLVESDGAEFTLVGDLTDSISFTANYAYNDTLVVEGDASSTVSAGDRFANAPRHQAGAWLRYDLPGIHSAVAFGADYVSEQMSLNGQRVKPYTIFDASWTTHWENWTLRVNVKNLFDKVYAVSGFSRRNGHFPGEPREIVAQLEYAL